ncbi:MAG: CopG family transcriptional regulator [Clostridium sp.]|uniref:CopG family transcriptional regulator n=1 Tax=Clostridium sp. TaxID=1506 RepID=UPI003031F40F
MINSKKLILSFNNSFNNKENQINCKLILGCGIVYSEGSNHNSYIEIMKQGYLEMKDLNLELSEYGFESCINDLNEYEASL